MNLRIRSSMVFILLIYSVSVLAGKTEDYANLSSRLSTSADSRIPVIIELASRVPTLESPADGSIVESLQNSVIAGLRNVNYSNLKRFGHLGMLAMTVNLEALTKLATDSSVGRIYYDEPMDIIPVTSSEPPLLYDSTVATQATQVWAQGHNGSGQVVAVLDTGVRRTHEMFAGKVVREACFSSNSYQSLTSCPNGTQTQTGANAARPDYGFEGYYHGTHVAGISVGDRKTGNPAGDGVARGAELIAVNVFSRFFSGCSGGGVCLRTYTSDVLRGLDYVYGLRNSLKIAAVNLSLGGGFYSTHCDTASPLTAAVNRLSNAGIAVVAASGNDGFTFGIAHPACISRVVSVGSTLYDGSSISSFSNSAGILDVLAPGGVIASAYADTDTGYAFISGTSMASPHVAGAFALLRSVSPHATVSEIETALKSTGVLMLDSRNGISRPFIHLLAAANGLPRYAGGAYLVPVIDLLLGG